MIIIYTDGSCTSNPGGPGGAAWIVKSAKRTVKRAQGYRATTSNRMELAAAVGALRATGRNNCVTVRSDSAYLVNCFRQGWWRRWERNGWHTSEGKPVKNRDLWEELLKLVRGRCVAFEHVKGHGGDLLNEECDRMAREAAADPWLEDEGYVKTKDD